MHNCGERGQKSRHDHACANRPPCAPSLSQHRARYLQGHIAQEEDADAETKHAIIEPKVARHSNPGVSHARAIEIVRDVKEENEWQQPKRKAAPCASSRCWCSRCNCG